MKTTTTKSTTEFYAAVKHSDEFLEFYKLINEGKNPGNFSGKIVCSAFRGIPTENQLRKKGIDNSEVELIKIRMADYMVISENERIKKILKTPAFVNCVPIELCNSENIIVIASDRLLNEMPEGFFK